VKRTVFVATGVAVLGLAIVVSSNLMAQNTGATPPATTTHSKVALLNLTYVIKNYAKFKTFQAELKSAVDPFQVKDTSWKKEGEAMVKESSDPKTTAERKDTIEKKLKELTRLIEDNKMEATKVLNKKQGEQLKILYNDVRAAAFRYAQAHGHDMVLHYNDAVTEQEYNSEPNISRKMQAGALMPIYMASGVDISYELVKTLNAAMPAAPAGGGARP
jgi:Skp family chaperone for outer membrane proteins